MKYCNNCGVELNDDAQFCGNCGAVCEIAQQPEYYQTQTPPQKGIPAYVYAIISALLVLIIAAVIFTIVIVTGGEGIELTVDQIPVETSGKTMTLSGTAEAGKGTAVLTVNGTTVDAVVKSDGIRYWTYDAELEKGDNTFVITLTDENGEAVTQTVSTYYDGSYPIGTMFVKCVKEGIFVRSAPYKGSKEIVLINKNDYDSHLEFLGGVETDNQGYDWYQVKTPHQGIGWVRSDIVTPVN